MVSIIVNPVLCIPYHFVQAEFVQPSVVLLLSKTSKACPPIYFARINPSRCVKVYNWVIGPLPGQFIIKLLTVIASFVTCMFRIVTSASEPMTMVNGPL